MGVFFCIFARGGSKGLPEKNIKSFHGHPLIGHTIRQIKKVHPTLRIYISTDCPRIAEIAEGYGGIIPFLRPPELATDEASEFLAWKHMVRWLDESVSESVEAIVSVPTTSPLREYVDIERCIAKYQQVNCDGVIAVTPSARNPMFNMVTFDDRGVVNLLMPPSGPLVRRQDVETCFDITTTCYVVSANFIRNSQSLFEGKLFAVEVDREKAIDIDTDLEFGIAEFLYDRT